MAGKRLRSGSVQRAERVISRSPGAAKKRSDLRWVDLIDRRRLPARRVILVDRQRTDAFHGFACGAWAQVETLVNQAPLQTQVVGQATQTGDVHAVVGELDIGEGSGVGLAPLQRNIKSRRPQTVFDGIKPLWALGVPCAHFMLPASLVGEISGGLAHL